MAALRTEVGPVDPKGRDVKLSDLNSGDWVAYDEHGALVDSCASLRQLRDRLIDEGVDLEAITFQRFFRNDDEGIRSGSEISFH